MRCIYIIYSLSDDNSLWIHHHKKQKLNIGVAQNIIKIDLFTLGTHLLPLFLSLSFSSLSLSPTFCTHAHTYTQRIFAFISNQPFGAYTFLILLLSFLSHISKHGHGHTCHEAKNAFARYTAYDA